MPLGRFRHSGAGNVLKREFDTNIYIHQRGLFFPAYRTRRTQSSVFVLHLQFGQFDTLDPLTPNADSRWIALHTLQHGTYSLVIPLNSVVTILFTFDCHWQSRVCMRRL